MSLRRTITLNPYGWQGDVLDALEMHAIVLVLAGRGAGKSLLFQLAAIREAFRGPRRKILYACHSHKLIRAQYNDLLASPGFENLLDPSRPCAESPTPWFRFRTGSVLTMVSMEKSGTNLGQECHLLILDECRELRQEAYNSLTPCVNRLGGHTLLLSTLRSQWHWFTELYRQGQDLPNDMDLKSFLVRSDEGPAYQGEDGKRRLIQMAATMSRREFARECLCVMEENELAVFPSSLLNAAARKELQPTTGSKEPTLLAADMGRRRDPTSLVIGDVKGNLLHAEVIPLGTNWDAQVARIKHLADAYNSTVVIETNGTARDSVLGLIRPRVEPHLLRDVMVRHSNQENLLESVLFRLEKKTLAWPDHPMFRELRIQLEAYEFKKDVERVAFSSSHEHDDYVWAVALYVEGLNRGWWGPLIGGW